MKPTTFNRFGVGAAAMVIAVAGGYMARAESDHAVNAHPAPAPIASAPASFADIVQKVAPAVVSIEVDGKTTPASFSSSGPRTFRFGGPDAGDDDSDGGALNGLPFDLRQFFGQQGPQQFEAQPTHGAGSGFFISADGYIATNNHVIDGADKITVHTADNRTFKARVVGRDKTTDLAVLKVDAGGLPFVSFEDSASPRVGDWVVAVGNPFGLGGTATAGIVSARDRRNVADSRYVNYLQIDAPINPGNSGGPTFDLQGRVVGINTAIYSPSGGGSVGIGFDIPADVASSVTKQLISGGKVSRGYIGATIQDVTPEIADSLGIEAKGALVSQVTPGGPADKAGLKSGDLVLKIDGHAVEDASDLTRMVGQTHAGNALRFDVRREGKPVELSLRAGERPSEDSLAAATDAPTDGPHDAVLGLNVAPDPKGDGVRVAGVARGSGAANQGLRPGDVIVQAGQHPTRSADDLAQAVKQARSSGRKQVLLLVERGGQRSFVPVEVGQG
jgi:serine protease Do